MSPSVVCSCLVMSCESGYSVNFLLSLALGPLGTTQDLAHPQM